MKESTSTGYKKLPWWLLAAIAAAFFVLVVFTNYRVDPGNLFRSGRADSVELTAVEIVSSGSNADNLDNYNERLVKRLLASSIEPREILALGSSRAALITRDMVESDSFFNFSLAGAALQEVISLYGIYCETNGAPERVIITADPWFFCREHGHERYVSSLSDGYYRYAVEHMGYDLDPADHQVNYLYTDPGTTGFWDLDTETKLQVCSVTYFQQAAKLALSGKSRLVTPTDAMSGKYGILRSDGSYSYPEEYCNVTPDVVENRGKGTGLIGGGTYELGTGGQRQIFEDFIQSLLKDGVEVDLILVPINPATYQKSLDAGIPLPEIERAVGEIAAEYAVDAVGSYDPAKLGMGYESFYDAYHLRPEGVAGLVALLQEGR